MLKCKCASTCTCTCVFERIEMANIAKFHLFCCTDVLFPIRCKWNVTFCSLLYCTCISYCMTDCYIVHVHVCWCLFCPIVGWWCLQPSHQHSLLLNHRTLFLYIFCYPLLSTLHIYMCSTFLYLHVHVEYKLERFGICLIHNSAHITAVSRH